MSSALLLIKSLSGFPALVSSSPSSSLVSKRACQKPRRNRINFFGWQLERFRDSSPLWHLRFGQICSPVFSFDIAGMVKGEEERMGNANGSGHAEAKDVGKSIGKVERERDDADNVKGFVKSIGKSEEETGGMSIGKVEAEGSNAGNAGNAEGLGKSVGKSEVQSVGKSIGKVEGEEDNVGNAKGLVRKYEEESVGKSVGKVEGEGYDADNVKGFGKSIGKCEEESVGKFVGKVEGEGDDVDNAKDFGKSIGKCEEESVGKSVGKVERDGDNVDNAKSSVGKCEENVGKSVGKIEGEGDDADNVKGFGKSIGKCEEGSVGKSVGKVEREEDNVGNAKGLVGKCEEENAGKSVGKIEGEGDDADNVKGFGKSIGKCEEESVGKSVGKVEREEDNVGNAKGLVGKCEEESVGKPVGKVEGEGDDAVGKSEEKGVGKAFGKVEGERGGENVANLKGCGKTVGKTEDEAVGKSVGKVEEKGGHSSTIKGPGKPVGNTEEEAAGKTVVRLRVEGEGQNPGEVEELVRTLGKTVDKTGGLMSKSEGVAAIESGHPGKAEKQMGGKTENENPEKVLEKKNSVEYVISVAGKSAVEKEFAESLTKDSDQTLKLPEGATLVVYHQTQKNKEDEFRTDVFMDQLCTRQFGRLLFYAHQMPSTHTLLSQNCKTLPVGALSVADVQFQGKGRAGNVWESPKGCLMFSFTLQMADGRAVPFLQYVVSLAVIEGIEDLCKSKDLTAPEVKIKWPNDLYAKGVKVGGVLCTSTYSAKKFHIVVGVGLNVGNRQPTTCLDALLGELNEHAPCLSRDELLATVMGKFEELFNLFSTQGFYALETQYYERWLHSGQTVVLEEKVEGNVEVSKIHLKIQGLTPAGYLRAVDDDSETYELHPDGNSFDFLKGLVRKKM